jgi:hypothetical protein
MHAPEAEIGRVIRHSVAPASALEVSAPLDKHRCHEHLHGVARQCLTVTLYHRIGAYCPAMQDLGIEKERGDQYR